MTQYSSVFVDKSDFLIQKGAQIEEIKSKGQAITFLGLDKKLVNRGAKEKSLNYRNDRRRYLSFLVESFNESTHE